MAPKRNIEHTSFAESASSFSQRRNQPAQYASEVDHRGEYRRGQHAHYGYSNSTDFRQGQEQGQTSPTPSSFANERQWSQQQAWGVFSSAYPASQIFPQPQSYIQPSPQQYPQYGHVNPAFFPQQPVANTQYPAQYPANATSGYGSPDTSFGTAYNGGQPTRYGFNFQTNQIPMANSEAFQATTNHQQYQNALRQPQPQNPGLSAPNDTIGYGQGARPKVAESAERYADEFKQLECLMNPAFMRPLTPPGENPRLYLLPRPAPTKEYLDRANLPPRRLAEPKKLLIVLDLNGTLLLRSSRGSSYTPRPHVEEFLAYCLEHHSLIVWSSARPHNVKAMVAQLFNSEQHAKLVKVWSREHLQLGVHFEAKVQVYKQLTWLWEDAEVQASFPATPFKVEDGWREPRSLPTKWDQSNTVLLDDTIEKAASEPYNLLEVDEFTKENRNDGDDVLGRVLAYIEDLKWQADVSAAIRERPFVNGQSAGWDWAGGERRASA